MRRAALLLLPALFATPAHARCAAGVPLCVIDGDTIHVREERIRIANIDAPETNSAKCDAERRLGLVAGRRLEEILTQGSFEIQRGDPQDGRLKDRYGRTLATLTVAGQDVGQRLIDEGLVRPWTGRREGWCK